MGAFVSMVSTQNHWPQGSYCGYDQEEMNLWSFAASKKFIYLGGGRHHRATGLLSSDKIKGLFHYD